MNKLELRIWRGLPGSGKSTAAKKFAEEHGYLEFENDEFFMKNGKYEFSQDKAKDAANWCYNETAKALRSGKSVCVANVFVTRKSVDRYKELAVKYGAEFTVLRSNASFGDVHDVPKAVYASMKRAFQDYSGEIDFTPKS